MAITIEVNPETERLLREEIARGRFESVDDLIVSGVYALREREPATPPKTPKKNLAQFLLESPLAGSNLKIERQRDYPHVFSPRLAGCGKANKGHR